MAVLPAVAASSSADPKRQPIQGVQTRESAAPSKKEDSMPMPTDALGCRKESFDRPGRPCPARRESPSATISAPHTRLSAVA